ncbi:MAG: hypothetical protein ACXAC6_19745 [Candidatus Hodarchaeales archaeon]|jgi:hypothetical protein
MMERLTLEDAEAKLIATISNLVWILPGLIILENLISIGILNSNSWSSSNTLSILASVLWVVVIFKIVNVVDRQLNAERELREKKTSKR